MKKLKVLDLFSGVGGFSLGLERSGGFETVAFCEIDEAARKVLRKHWKDTRIFEDVKELNMGRLKKLTEDQVDESIKLYREGLSLQDIGEYYNVSRQSMHDLLKRRIKLRPQKRYGKDNNFYRGGISADPRAHDLMEKAVMKGIISPSSICEECGDSGEMSDGRNIIQGHHNDYNKPLDVTWLCQPCHHEWHKHNSAIKKKEAGEDIDVIVGGFPC